jgi:uncharacterized membrane protein YdjX (TVP38/TMEM64 family)
MAGGLTLQIQNIRQRICNGSILNRRTILILVVVALCIIFALYTTIRGEIGSDMFVRLMVFERYLPPLLRVLIVGIPYSILVFICVPSSVIGAFVGLIQGVPLAFLTVMLGETIGAIGSYVCVRRLGFDMSVRVPESIRKVFVSPSQRIRASIAFRMLPLPTFLKNYGLVLSTKLSFRTFIIGVLIGGLPYNIFFPLAGLRVRDASEVLSWSWWNVVEIAVVMIGLFVSVKWARSYFESKELEATSRSKKSKETKGDDGLCPGGRRPSAGGAPEIIFEV